MSRTIPEEWHAVIGVSRPHPTRLFGRHAGSGFVPVSAAPATLLSGPNSREVDNSRRARRGPANMSGKRRSCGRRADDACHNSTAPGDDRFGAAFFSKSVPKGPPVKGARRRPLRPPRSNRRSPKAGDLRVAPNNTGLSVRGSVLTCTTSRNLRPRAREGDRTVQPSFLRRSAPMQSTWLKSLRSSPRQLLWWLRWQLYSVRPEVRATARQRRRTLRYRRTAADDCPPRPPDWWPW